MKVQIITIGDELLIGQVIDSNAAWIGQRLNERGFEVEKITSISDTEAAIKSALQDALSQADIVLITGGLGPTKDDITKKALAEYFGAEMVFDESTYNQIQRLFKQLGRSTNDAHMEQSYMPSNAEILLNKMGTAPGMWFEQEGKVVVSMPGVPYEMKHLMEAEVLPRLQKKYDGIAIVHRTICTAGEGEARLAHKLQAYLDTLPDFIKVAYLPSLAVVRIRLTARGVQEEELQQLLDEKVKEIQALIPEFVFGFEQDTLASVLGKILLRQNKKLTLAESCTGGYLAHCITSIAGSSRYFEGGFVTYSNDLKTKLLNVTPATLARVGAVSEETVLEMLHGSLQKTGADVGIAVSGIAGPGGGSPEKPVGTIWLAVGSTARQKTKRLQLAKDRSRNIQHSAMAGLNMLRKFLLEG